MIEFGKTLREAREAKGYSISQIAEATHMLSSIVQNLEDEDFSKIVAPIYGRGFVKLYCEAVGIDPKPLIAEFMEIYNGNRQLEIKERPQATSQPEPSKPVPPPITAAEPPKASAEELFQHFENTETPPPPPPPPLQKPAAPQPMPPEQEPDLFHLPADAAVPSPNVERPFSKYAAPSEVFAERPKVSFKMPKFKMPSVKMPSVDVPPSFWRIAAIAIVVLALLAAVGYGIFALYRATTLAAPERQEKAAVRTPVARPVDTTPAPKPASPARTPQKVPSLYID